jgi:hypothetical protein|tara:strand:+ start:1556 stop:1831 length:276 start_codon:yes stop_codon:yes gene_type:complete
MSNNVNNNAPNNNARNNNNYNSDRLYQPVTFKNDNDKWDQCNIRQHIAMYSFNVEPNGFISVGGRPETVSQAGKFPDFEKEGNPLNLINKK